ncbi:MAG: BtpA/SgcQ family protein [Phycisphaerales bacterium]|nr:BtpA/SgcQ family protein [Phycisphaerales bacterium]
MNHLPPRALVGMVHLAALPGTPRHRHPVDRIAELAVRDATVLVRAGFDAVLVENMSDVPYLPRDVGPEIVAAMTAAVAAVRSAVRVPIGVQVLAGANRAAMAVAHASGASFIRAEGFVFASVADEGLLAEADAGPLLRYRRAIGADGIGIFCDIKKKHSSHALTADVNLAETAGAAAFCGADAVVVTGRTTGAATAIDDLRAARAGTALPVMVGSGATAASLPTLLAHADAVIVGSSIKSGGRWDRPVDARRARAFVKAAGRRRR